METEISILEKRHVAGYRRLPLLTFRFLPKLRRHLILHTFYIPMKSREDTGLEAGGAGGVVATSLQTENTTTYLFTL